MFNYQTYVDSLEKKNLLFSNPLEPYIDSMSAEEIEWIVREYSQFSNEAIHLLLDARIRTYGWPKLSKEIDRNIEEEKGTKTYMVPHLEIMRRGYLFAIDFDVNNYFPSMVTQSFLRRMREVFRHRDEAYIAGAILALESTSVPEFEMVDRIFNRFFSLTGIPRNEHIAAYIDGHKEFEVGHKQGLLESIEPYITEKNAESFSVGYADVCNVMKEWWEGLGWVATLVEEE